MVINMCKIIKEKIKMLFGKKPYPILPTSESDTLTFLQKLDMLEYKVSEMNNKIYEIETSLATKSSVSATASGDVIQTITIDGETLDIPQGTEVSATGSEGTLETLTVDGTTYNVPQGGGIAGRATVGAYSIGQWKLVNDMLFFELVYAAGTDAFDNNIIAVRLTDSDNHNYGGLDGKTIKTIISWLHTESNVTWPVWAEIQLNIIEDGLGTLTLTKGAYVLEGSTSLSGAAVLADLKGLPITFMNVPTL
jgi:hypothetical protein